MHSGCSQLIRAVKAFCLEYWGMILNFPTSLKFARHETLDPFHCIEHAALECQRSIHLPITVLQQASCVARIMYCSTHHVLQHASFICQWNSTLYCSTHSGEPPPKLSWLWTSSPAKSTPASSLWAAKTTASPSAPWKEESWGS